MASGGGNRSSRRKDVQNEDPSIIGFSNSFPGSSAPRNKQNNGQRSSHSAGHPHQPRPKPQNQKKTYNQTPNSSDRKRDDHWKVMDPNVPQILFGAENPPFRFDNDYGRSVGHGPYGYGNHQNNTGRNYGPGGYKGARNSPQWGRYYYPKPGINDSRNPNYRHGAQQQANPRTQNHAKMAPQPSAGKPDLKQSNRERPDKNENKKKIGDIEAENMTVTVSNKANGKRTVDIAANQAKHSEEAQAAVTSHGSESALKNGIKRLFMFYCFLG